MTRLPFAVNVRDAPAYWSLGELLTVVATAEQTGGAFSLMEELLPRGAEPPPHVHRREDEAFFVLEGALTVRVGDQVFPAEAGSFVFCPRDVPHLLTVESEQVRMLTLVTPAAWSRCSSSSANRREPGRSRRPTRWNPTSSGSSGSPRTTGPRS